MTKRTTRTIQDPDEDSPPVLETEQEGFTFEETAVPDEPVAVKETAVSAPSPSLPKPDSAKTSLSPAALVWVRLDGASTAAIGHQVILQGESIQTQYQHYTQAKQANPGVFSVKLPGADAFVTE